MLGTTNLLLLLLYLAFVFIADPLEKEVKQERNLRVRKKNSENERGGEKEEEIRRIK